MKKIAIVGAGFCGLALSYYLLKLGADVTLFDGKGIGGGASGIASGLLHPYPGESARLSWRGHEGMEATKNLLEVVGKEVYKKSGILKIAVTPKQENAFRKLAKRYDDIEWWSAERCHDFIQGSHYLPGIFIQSGMTVHAASYLKGLWRVCATLGGRFKKRNVALTDLAGFEAAVLAVGAGIREFDARKGLDLRFNKGQVLVCQKPRYFETESSLIGKGYLALGQSGERCYLGSTYERDYTTEQPCMGIATDLIFKQIGQFIPSYRPFKVEGCLSGMRVVSGRSGRRPIAQKVDDKLYVMTGMGSRGLLYHAYFGKLLAQEMIQ